MPTDWPVCSVDWSIIPWTFDTVEGSIPSAGMYGKQPIDVSLILMLLFLCLKSVTSGEDFFKKYLQI